MNRSTDLARAMVPRGTVPFFPELAARKRTVEARLWDTFSRWGYREIIPPLFEYLDVLSQGLAPETVAATSRPARPGASQCFPVFCGFVVPCK